MKRVRISVSGFCYFGEKGLVSPLENPYDSECPRADVDKTVEVDIDDEQEDIAGAVDAIADEVFYGEIPSDARNEEYSYTYCLI